MQFKALVTGRPQPLVPAIADDIHRICREALTNIINHAHATEIEVELAYDAEEMRLRIRDNGRGIDADVLRAGARQGHFGLQGMRERAKRIGADLNIWSGAGAGAEVDLKVPAQIAYHSSQKKRRNLAFIWPRSIDDL
jgi:signal transduction histidine kinase